MTHLIKTGTLPFVGVLAITTLLIPQPTAALSCISPFEYIDELVIQADTTIFTGEIIDTYATNGNVTALDIAVQEAYKGTVTEVTRVQYEYDDTWSYLCTNAPGALGTSEIFITRPSDDTAPYVIYSFTADSELNTVLEAALATHEPTGVITASEPLPTPPVVEPTRQSLLEHIIDLLQQLIARLQGNEPVRPLPAPEPVPPIAEPIPIEPPPPVDVPTDPAGPHDDIIGLSVVEAETYAAAAGVRFRIGWLDGQPLALTEDYVPGRITAEVADDTVLGYTVEDDINLAPPTLEPTDPETDHTAIIGLTVAEAKLYAAEQNVPFRIGSLDGEFMALTMDYVPGRITADVEDDVVVGYSVE